MNWSVKLAKSLIKDKTLQRHYFIQLICQLAIVLCLSTILISSFLVRGFEKTIEDKIFNFWSHIRISPIGNSANPIGEVPLHIKLQDIKNNQLKKSTAVVNKGGILRYKNNIEGIILRGLDLKNKIDYQLTSHLPHNPQIELPLILSQFTLDKLNAKIGQGIFISIVDSVPKTFKAKIINSYVTHIDEFDAQIAITDIQFLQNLNHWSEEEYSWIEIQAKDKQQIDLLAEDLYEQLPDVSVETIYSIYPQLFDWLALMKKNELIIFIVMLIVAIVNVISAISIFVIEKTKLIGMLKVLGAQNKSIVYMLYIQVLYVLMRGIVFGNFLALSITAIIYYFKPIQLDPSVYYISYAPILFDWKALIFINMLTIFTCLISAYIPLKTIEKISPIKVVEFK